MNWKDRFYKDLRALEKACFPKVCCNCGRIYNSVHDFIDTTQATRGKSGLLDVEPGRKAVGLMRNCACHSTLMIVCSDRRDTSEAGRKKRLIFQRLLNTLVGAGMNADSAREKLIAWLREGTDPVAGITVKEAK